MTLKDWAAGLAPSGHWRAGIGVWAVRAAAKAGCAVNRLASGRRRRVSLSIGVGTRFPRPGGTCRLARASDLYYCH